ncbi:hypothetical protein AB1Y20_019810 [Prymnesium parvum]|uniref:LicD/FKTN/FKRP nucleotidyltransferase domain-containing protein n=1 Tax=Prymnesium parvum TaxID=97485 RepID=A0AB34JVI8_PRYPA
MALPSALEPTAGAAQCSYELMRAFARYTAARLPGLRFSLGAGTLLGAMRNEPAGLLRWEHDLDLYVPANDAARLRRAVRHDCADAPLLPLCGHLAARPDAKCCGFGFKLFHRQRGCELDVLVLALSDAPFGHGELPWWPPWSTVFAWPAHRISALCRRVWRRYVGAGDGDAAQGGEGAVFVIPEDIYHKDLMAESVTRWCSSEPLELASEWSWCGGPALSYFQSEYMYVHEFFPLRWIQWYDLKLPIPRRPWDILNRTYGADCAYIAWMNEHGHAGPFDLRLSQYTHLRQPAAVNTKAALF